MTGFERSLLVKFWEENRPFEEIRFLRSWFKSGRTYEELMDYLHDLQRKLDSKK